MPNKIYDYLLSSDSIPKWQWTIIDPATRIRFLAWSYFRDWSCGQVFSKIVIYLALIIRLFGSDSKTEFNTALPGTFERSCQNFWKLLEVERKTSEKVKSLWVIPFPKNSVFFQS